MKVQGRVMDCTINTSEHFYDYQDLFMKYFRNATHHLTGRHYINKDAILIFSYLPENMDCANCKERFSTLSIDSSDGVSPSSSVFYDNSTDNDFCRRMVEIRYCGKFVGKYCKKNNIIFTTDIAHYGGNRRHISTILDKMEEVGLLKPIDSKLMEKANITLGTDPEMEAVVDGEIVDGNTRPSFGNYEKQYISWDGARVQRELRPDPSTEPEELVENIRDLIKVSSFLGEDLSVTGKKFPLGGHIHIGGMGPSNNIILLLDYFLSPFTCLNSEIRKASHYGKVGDFRHQPYGFEYRAPPSAWLLTPKLALMTLQLTKKIAEIYSTGIDIEIEDQKLPSVVVTEEKYREHMKQFFDEKWTDEFLNEIHFAMEHINEPLAKMWGVEIPKEYKVSRQYKYKHPEVPHSSVRSVPLGEPEEEEEPTPDHSFVPLEEFV